MLNQDQVQALKSPFPPEALWRGTLAGSVVDGARAMVGFDDRPLELCFAP
jgi:hypothetical protein